MGIFDFLKPPYWHLAIGVNELTVTRPETGKSMRHVAEIPFSDAQDLVTDAELLERTAMQLFTRFADRSLIARYPVVEIVATARPLSDAERKPVSEAIANAGAHDVILPPN